MSPTYDLMLLLDTTAPPERREQILAEVEQKVRAEGEIVGRHDWGIRHLAYEIRHKADAEYHLLQLTGPPSLLAELDRSLKITDGVVRFRIIKLRPGTPAPPELRPDPPRAAEPAVEDVAPPPAPAPSTP